MVRFTSHYTEKSVNKQANKLWNFKTSEKKFDYLKPAVLICPMRRQCILTGPQHTTYMLFVKSMIGYLSLRLYIRTMSVVLYVFVYYLGNSV